MTCCGFVGSMSFCFFLWRGSNVNRFFSFSFSFFWDVGTPRSWARAAPCFRGWMFLHRWILLLFVCGLDNWWDFPFIISFYFFLLPLSSYSKLKLSNFLASEKKFLVELRKGFFFFFFFSFLSWFYRRGCAHVRTLLTIFVCFWGGYILYLLVGKKIWYFIGLIIEGFVRDQETQPWLPTAGTNNRLLTFNDNLTIA